MICAELLQLQTSQLAMILKMGLIMDTARYIPARHFGLFQ